MAPGKEGQSGDLGSRIFVQGDIRFLPANLVILLSAAHWKKMISMIKVKIFLPDRGEQTC